MDVPRPSTRRVWLSQLLAVGVASSGCAGVRKHQERKIPQFGVVDADQPRELNKVSMPAHVVEPPDELQISVRPSSLGVEVRSAIVQPDGNIHIDFVGDVYVAGLTLQQVEWKLIGQLAPLARQQRLSDPVQVSVRLVDGRKSKVYYVLGTVSNPGSFAITGNETVLDGILEAKLRPNSLPEKAYLVRPHPVNGADQILSIDWFGITQRGDTMTNYQLLPGDRIYVPGGKPPGLLQTLLGG